MPLFVSLGTVMPRRKNRSGLPKGVGWNENYKKYHVSIATVLVFHRVMLMASFLEIIIQQTDTGKAALQRIHQVDTHMRLY